MASSQLLQLNFQCILVVWGVDYTETFLEIALPSQLSPGNLCSLKNVTYQIYTTEKNSEIIKKHQNFKRLQELMPIEFHLITDEKKNKYETMSECHRRAISYSKKSNSVLIFLTPDTIISDGSLIRVQQLASEGIRVISTVGLRLNLENIKPLIKEYFKEKNNCIQISSRDLMKIALENLHEITLKHIWGGHEEMICNNLFWFVPNEGLLGRCFHLHPLMVYPKNRDLNFLTTIDYDYPQNACPDIRDHYIVSDSDEICICELTTTSRYMRGVKNASLKELSYFSESYVCNAHFNNASTPIRMHNGKITEDKWKSALNKSNQVFNYVFSLKNQNSFKLLLENPKLFAIRLINQTKNKKNLTYFQKCQAIFIKVLLSIYSIHKRIFMKY